MLLAKVMFLILFCSGWCWLCWFTFKHEEHPKYEKHYAVHVHRNVNIPHLHQDMVGNKGVYLMIFFIVFGNV